VSQHKAVRGFLANIKSKPPLIILFQWNPTDVKESRTVKYADVELGGYQAPIQVFSAGGATTYSFQLTLDATENSRIFNVFRVDLPLVGIGATVSALKSFTYPANDKLLKFLQSNSVGEPPACYFGLGSKVMRGRIRSLHINYKLFSRLLVPLQATVDIEFTVDEYGVWSKIDAIYRRITSTANPALGGFGGLI